MTSAREEKFALERPPPPSTNLPPFPQLKKKHVIRIKRSAGLFGYFPCYYLGAMAAAQFYQHAASQLPDLEAQIARGEFKPLRVRGRMWCCGCKSVSVFACVWGQWDALPTLKIRAHVQNKHTTTRHPPPTPSQQEWLAKAIHARGSLDPSGDALLEAVTGSKLQPSILLNHLRAKYAALYKLPAQQQT